MGETETCTKENVDQFSDEQSGNHNQENISQAGQDDGSDHRCAAAFPADEVADADRVLTRPAPHVDHGWAWMVVFGCSMMHFLVGGFSRSYGIMYMYLQERFDSSAAITAWIGGTASALRMLSSPLATALSNRFNARSVVIVGGVLCGLGGVLSTFAPSAEYMFFSYSLFEGLGGSLVYVPGILMVSQYFDKYRSIAMGLATAGSGLGVFIYPPIMQMLFSEYGFFGAMLVTGAVMFNNIISGALYRPVPEPKKQKDGEKTELLEEQHAETKLMDDHQTKYQSSEATLRLQLLQTVNEGLSNSAKNLFASNWSMLHKVQPEENPELTAKSHKCCSMSKFNKYLDLRLFRCPTFMLYAASQAFVTYSYISAQMLVPIFATDQGIASDDSVWLLSVIGICDMIGRVASGFIFNIPCINVHRRHYYTFCIVISGLTHFFLLKSKQYVMFVVICTVHGLFNGVVVSQRAVICIDLIGMENLSSSFGLTIFIQGTGVLVGPVIAGYLRDLTGSYFYSFIFTGASSLFAAMLIFLEWLLIARHRHSSKQEVSKEGKMTRIDSIVVGGGAICDKHNDFCDSEIFSPISSQVEGECDDNDSALLPLYKDDLEDFKVKVIVLGDDRNLFSKDANV